MKSKKCRIFAAVLINNLAISMRLQIKGFINFGFWF